MNCGKTVQYSNIVMYPVIKTLLCYSHGTVIQLGQPDAPNQGGWGNYDVGKHQHRGGSG